MKGAILKSFTYNNSGGNGAGVILLNNQISDSEKQAIAAKIGLSETAFVLQRDEENFDVSFFTPICEVELCGHATIAAFYYLGLIGVISGTNEVKKVIQHTKAGSLEIEVMFKDGTVDYVLMQQQAPQIYEELIGNDLKKIAYSLNVSEKNIGLKNVDIFPTIVSTGLKDILVPVMSKDILNSMEVNFNMINDISLENDVVGYHVYTIENGNIYARNFAPLVGINEECATGTSNGALGGLLFKKKLISNEAQVIQGESMNEKSLVCVKVSEVQNAIDVRVGGKASIIDEML